MLMSIQYHIPIVFSTNESWAPYVGVAVHSLCKKINPNDCYDIWVMHDGLSPEVMEELVKVTECYENVELNFRTLEKLQQEKLNNKNLHAIAYSYYRLWLGMLFPEYDRMIYLDVDVLLNADIAELYRTDLGNALIGSVTDTSILKSLSLGESALNPNIQLLEQLGIKDIRQYFNNGVLVLDLKRIREERREDVLMKLLSRDTFFNHDQDIFNIAFFGFRKHLPVEWNFQFEPYLKDEPDTARWKGTEFSDVPTIHKEKSWKILHLIESKPWDVNSKAVANVVHGLLWWKTAFSMPSFQAHLKEVFDLSLKAVRKNLNQHQWKIFCSFGHARTKRKRRIKALEEYLSMLEQLADENGIRKY
ncbi:glycosyltransferase family 8 protein [Akkermansia sp.]|uniref:glycosyltransferase family 8 protein n=1 Tax=Akkermansia sp. TaxID=1872421 RepID=UPI0025C56C2D|nr:glycosyltransferase family 8 protein [Akkermansia sp.]MCC8148522.1 glycosyltransferase family 8 protein [Akkermansia sp.]